MNFISISEGMCNIIFVAHIGALGGLPDGGLCELYIFNFFITIPQGPLGTTPGTFKGNRLLV